MLPQILLLLETFLTFLIPHLLTLLHVIRQR